MYTEKIESIALEIEKIVFDDSAYCTILGKAYELNGFYYANIVLKIQELYTLILHNENNGRMLHWAISQALIENCEEYPIVINVNKIFGQNILFNANKIFLNKIKAIDKNENGAIHYCLQIESFIKQNQLQIVKNTLAINKIIAVASKKVIDDLKLKNAYQLYLSFKKLDIKEEIAREKSGLKNKGLFNYAYISCSA